jgi:ankyrin repeat protein
VLKEMATANRRQAYHLLQCLTVASRPLRVEELAEILALDFDGAKGGIPKLKENWRWRDQQEAVLSMCSSLIAVVDSGRHRVVQFSHFSVKEFLTSDRLAASVADVSYFHILPEPAHTVIAKACLGILLQSDKDVGGADTTSNSPLAKYAAEHWVGHAQFGEVSTIVEDGMRRLFDLAKPHFAAWLKLYDLDRYWDSFVRQDWRRILPRRSPLYYASLCGFRDLAAHLVEENPRHLNARVGRNRSPLVAALPNKHFHIAELLYQRGAKLNIRGTNNFTPLLAASVDRSIDIVQWLLVRGGNANLRNDNDETPLHCAVKNGQIELVRILLRHGVIVNAKDMDKRTPLHLASEQGEDEIALLLLRHGADFTVQDLRHSTPLHLASVSITSARRLFQHSAHVKEQQHSYYDPEFDEGETNPTAKTVQILLEHGADVTMQDDIRSTPLHLASSNGSLEVARLLIKHGADVNARDRHLSTPLHLASSTVSPEIVQLLIEHGADMAARDRIQCTPLHLASSAKSPKVVRVLVKHGAGVNALNWNRMMPLHLALVEVSVNTW